jgi:uncharacterized protein (TIGR00255 family)
MAIKSMTGHGSGRIPSKSCSVSVELSSVNHRQFDLRIISPPMAAAVEAGVAERIRARIARGSVTCRIKFDCSARPYEFVELIDESLAKAWVESLRRLARKLKLEFNLSAAVVAGLPGVCRSRSEDVCVQKASRVLFECLDGALASLSAMRSAEGKALGRDLDKRFSSLEGLAGRIARRMPAVWKAHEAALRKKIASIGADINSGDSRLARELAVFADRSDISEELTRLRSHLEQARKSLDSRHPAGRKLDFLIQEMNREINTIASKANDLAVAKETIAFKSELERAREQVQNVE